MFSNKSILPLNHMLDMPEFCPVCGQRMELEVGFYYGTGYVSYAISVALLGIIFAAYWAIFGLSFRDNSMIIALSTAVGITVLAQPWLMRYSRVLYLYFFVKYGEGSTIDKEQNAF